MDYQRFECIYHVVTAAHYGTLQEALRAVELSKGELVTILHRIEWDDSTRLFRIHDDRLVFTREGAERVRIWEEALRTLGIVR